MVNSKTAGDLNQFNKTSYLILLQLTLQIYFFSSCVV